MKPYAESCDQNRDPILEVLIHLFAHSSKVLEIGSGTGQHAVFFSRKMPHLFWQTSDRVEFQAGIRMWVQESGLTNVAPPLLLDVSQAVWPAFEADAVFSANTAHIMHLPEVEAMILGVGRVLSAAGVFALYGPFNYQSRYTSASNARFDQWLKSRDPDSGIRDFETLNNLAEKGGMSLVDDFEMPANNLLLAWRKKP
jgi:cyclopropane fatty-acyl-phospholipid synthase-like methyltransferase